MLLWLQKWINKQMCNLIREQQLIPDGFEWAPPWPVVIPDLINRIAPLNGTAFVVEQVIRSVGLKHYLFKIFVCQKNSYFQVQTHFLYNALCLLYHISGYTTLIREGTVEESTKNTFQISIYHSFLCTARSFTYFYRILQIVVLRLKSFQAMFPNRMNEECFEILCLGPHMSGEGNLPLELHAIGINVIDVWPCGQQKHSLSSKQSLNIICHKNKHTKLISVFQIIYTSTKIVNITHDKGIREGTRCPLPLCHPVIFHVILFFYLETILFWRFLFTIPKKLQSFDFCLIYYLLNVALNLWHPP